MKFYKQVNLIHPIHLIAVSQYFIAVATFILVFVCFWIFIRTKHRLERWEAVMLLLLYLTFLIAELSKMP